MNRALAIARKDVLQIVRDKKIAAILVVMPLLFTAALGSALETVDAAVRPQLLVLVDEDQRQRADDLLRLLEDPGGLDVELLAPEGREDAVARVKQGDAEAVLALSSTALTTLRRGEMPKVEVVADQNLPEANLAIGALEASLFRAAVSYQTGVADRVAAWRGRSGVQRRTFTQGGAGVAPTGMRQASPGILIQFAIMSLIGSAGILFTERKRGMLARLLAGPIARTTVIVGHGLAMFTIAFGQMLILVVGGQLLFGVDYARSPLGIAIILVTFAVFLAALSLCVGAFAKKEDHVVIFSLAAMFLLAGLGGAWVPLSAMGEAAQTLGHLLPSAWALDGLQNIVVRDLDASSTLLPSVIILVWALGLGALAVWRLGRGTATRA